MKYNIVSICDNKVSATIESENEKEALIQFRKNSTQNYCFVRTNGRWSLVSSFGLRLRAERAL